ncbi:hypothetical protein PEBR_40964 [Penicillium brasilianum]|uniref:Metallo-beta-lactamase domain-containing protein n=1 Tax=Penicillium brasilianum TaxID=104259 RepID=A0A1S9R8T7_PENBI|nr:hypothetical protein PEBR_40964 [Penicillium brasilianum]
MTTMEAKQDHGELLTSDYSIESFQLPVPAGDCSIHLLLKKSHKSTSEGLSYVRGIKRKNERGEIHRAVLVDGGHDGDNLEGEMAAEAIRHVIEAIEDDFGQKLQFDAWVVTHWDRDHYCGTLHMLVENMQDNFKLSSDDEEKTEKQKTDKMTTKEEKKDGEKMNEETKDRDVPKYFKYVGDKPATTLYCPSFKLSKERKKKKEADAAKKKAAGKKARSVNVDLPHCRLRSSEEKETGTDAKKTTYVDVMLAYRDIPEPGRVEAGNKRATPPPQQPEREDSDEEDKQEQKEKKSKKGKKSEDLGLKGKLMHKDAAQQKKAAVFAPTPTYAYYSLNASMAAKPVDEYWQKQICKLVEGWDQLRGMDFFSGVSKIPSTPGITGTTSMTAADLIGHVKDQPVMSQFSILERLSALDTNTVSDALDFLNLEGATYGLRPLWACPKIVLCIGAEGYLLNKPPGDQQPRRAAHQKKVTDERKEREKARQAANKPRKAPSGDTWENYISIMSLIVWPKSARNNQQGRISYFCGGDANAVSEEELAEWLNGYSVPVVKASHHGASTATPSKLLRGLDPEKVLLPAGYMYGHPNWTVMALLFAYWEDKVARLKSQPTEKLAMPLRSPYFLEGRNYKKPNEPRLMEQVDLNPYNVPNYTDLFAKFKSAKTGPKPMDMMTEKYTPGKYRELTVAEALNMCTQVAEKVDTITDLFVDPNAPKLTVKTAGSAEKVKKLEEVTFLEGQAWLSTFISDLQDFDQKLHQAAKSAETTKSKGKPKKVTPPEQQCKTFRPLRIRQYLFIMMLSEYWSSIPMQYLWTRSCENSILDGRVLAFESWDKVLPSRGEPMSARDGKIIIPMMLDENAGQSFPNMSPEMLGAGAVDGPQFQAQFQGFAEFEGVNVSIDIPVYDSSDGFEYEDEYDESESDEDSAEVNIILKHNSDEFAEEEITKNRKQEVSAEN